VEETPAELLYRAMLPSLPQYMVSRWPSILYIVSYDKATVFYCRPGVVKVGMIRFHAGHCTSGPNVALVFCVYFVLQCSVVYWCMSTFVSIRPHRSTTYVDTVCCYRCSSTVCLSVCHSRELCKNS